MAIEYHGHLPSLQEAFRSGKLTFYLGAGVSKPNGLPSWEEFVQALYFTTLNDESFIYELKPYPNYLFALAEWVLKQKNEPMDIIIRKIRQWYEGKDFIGMMTNTLYAGLARDNIGPDISGLPEYILERNATLKAILECSVRSIPGLSGLRSIITYNYDNLVELGLECYPAAKNNDPSPELDQIRQKAEQYLTRFPQSRMKMPEKEPRQIQQLLEKIYQYEKSEFEKGFENLGLHLITIDDFDEIQLVLQQVAEG